MQITKPQLSDIAYNHVSHILLPTRRTAPFHLHTTTPRIYCYGKYAPNYGYIVEYPASTNEVKRLRALGYEKVTVSVWTSELVNPYELLDHMYESMLVYNPRETGDAMLRVVNASQLPFGLPHKMYLMRVSCQEGIGF